MSGVEVLPVGAIVGAATQVAWFLPVLVAAIAYFHYEVNDPESRIIDQPGELLLNEYDFIIVGAGSAGDCSKIYLNVVFTRRRVRSQRRTLKFFKGGVQKKKCVRFFIKYNHAVIVWIKMNIENKFITLNE